MPNVRCANPQCGRPYSLIEMCGWGHDKKEVQEIACPHCEHTRSVTSNGVVFVEPLAPEEEAKFNYENTSAS